MSDAALQVRNLSFSIGASEILRDISFDVAEGEYCSIIGPNGAGKSSLLKCIMRIYRGFSGHVEIQGKPLEKYSQKELAARVSYVPQAGGRQPFPFTVLEFVLMGRYPHLSAFSVIRSEDETAAREYMQITGVEEFADRSLSTLSGGERQKVYITAALAQGGDILLLDEPTSFLDYRHQADVLRLLQKINRESGATIISVTHDINCALLSSNRVIALKKGSVVFNDAPAALLEGQRLSEIYDAEFQFLRHGESGSTVVAPQGIGL